MSKLKDLKEMSIKEWDGMPFQAYVDDGSDNMAIEEIVSYDSKYDKPWGTEQCNNYLHVYPVEWNKEKVEESSKLKRMTNRQLAKWLAKGNGQKVYVSKVDLSIDNRAPTMVCHTYDFCYDADECNNRVRVRKWNSEEWIEPTVDLLEEPCTLVDILEPNANNALDNMYAERIQNSCHTGDDERDHVEADEIVCNLLTELGFHKVVEAYEDVGKWYA